MSDITEIDNVEHTSKEDCCQTCFIIQKNKEFHKNRLSKLISIQTALYKKIEGSFKQKLWSIIAIKSMLADTKKISNIAKDKGTLTIQQMMEEKIKEDNTLLDNLRNTMDKIGYKIDILQEIFNEESKNLDSDNEEDEDEDEDYEENK